MFAYHYLTASTAYMLFQSYGHFRI